MSSLLGKTMQWALDGPAVDNYNQQTASAAPPLVAGEVRPVVVVGENLEHTPQGTDGHTVNVQVYTDGPQVHYVPSVPVGALSELGAPTPEPAKPPAECNNSLSVPCPLHGTEHIFDAATGKFDGANDRGEAPDTTPPPLDTGKTSPVPDAPPKVAGDTSGYTPPPPPPKASGSGSGETSTAVPAPDSHAGESPVADGKSTDPKWSEANQGTGDTYNPTSGPYPPPLAGQADNPAPDTAATQGDRTQANATGTAGSAQTGAQAAGPAATAGTGSPT